MVSEVSEERIRYSISDKSELYDIENALDQKPLIFEESKLVAQYGGLKLKTNQETQQFHAPVLIVDDNSLNMVAI